ncbi:Indigoidine synthase A like protein-domain-containing protein [Chaetomium tenue]|uniref:Indigoidine synthase A like protein-domain-containing protein n=1 Tax=Chaetomium tenue TaxID=1854479 RepID=A0ACB7PS93_9PEZI|nr:Indigoidine synthase A like protein-domain-containing protein [Chaetomium globosum]
MAITTATRALSRAPIRNHHHFLSTRRFTTTTHPTLPPSLLTLSPEVTTALTTNQPLVALESTIYTHGALGGTLAQELEDVVRSHGAVPAVCGILAGKPTVGLTPAEIARMVREGAAKASRRDLARLSAPAVLGRTGAGGHGGTTISGTMVLARLAGIRVFGTGGLGGVHRGGESSMDVSADLTELGRTRVAVFLETQGAFVATFADGRAVVDGKGVDFPAFWARESGVPSPAVVRDERDAAAIILAQERLGVESGMLFANPIPEEAGIPRKEMELVIETAVREAAEKGFTGSANTPYVLTRIRQLTEERSTTANVALVRSNVARAAKISVELAKLLDGAPVTVKAGVDGTNQASTPAAKVQSGVDTTAKPEDPHPVDVLVAGSVALDLNCDYTGGKTVSPALHTSNPSSISQSVGGVGHNIALAAHRISGDGKVRLCSMVGDDIAGSTILSTLRATGLDTSSIRQLGAEFPSTRTAQYVAVNDADKNLVMAMADMDIFTTHSFPADWASTVATSKPKWLVVDANWSETDIQTWLRAGAHHNARTAFEPVSATKSQRLFPALPKNNKPPTLGVYPHPTVDLCTPNQHELLAMYEAARARGYLEHGAPWFGVLDGFGIMAGARDRFVDIAGAAVADSGVPVQCVNLLPYIPTIVAKMGEGGALLVMVLGKGDPRLRDPEQARWVRAAVLTLRSKESVSEEVRGLRGDLRRAVEESRR